MRHSVRLGPGKRALPQKSYGCHEGLLEIQKSRHYNQFTENRISDPSWSDQLFGALTGFNGDDENPRPLEKNQFAGGQK